MRPFSRFSRFLCSSFKSLLPILRNRDNLDRDCDNFFRVILCFPRLYAMVKYESILCIVRPASGLFDMFRGLTVLQRCHLKHCFPFGPPITCTCLVYIPMRNRPRFCSQDLRSIFIVENDIKRFYRRLSTQ